MQIVGFPMGQLILGNSLVIIIQFTCQLCIHTSYENVDEFMCKRNSVGFEWHLKDEQHFSELHTRLMSSQKYYLNVHIINSLMALL